MAEDSFTLGGHTFHSRFILGSGKYSLTLIDAAVRYAEAELVTVAVRRANTKEKENILDYVPKNVTLLPNTSGARTAEEAVRIAHLAKALGCGDFVKIEIMRDSKYLLPAVIETIRAAEILAKEGFGGQHGPRDGRRRAAHGLGLPRRDTRRPQGIPLRPWPRADARCRRFRPADGLPS